MMSPIREEWDAKRKAAEDSGWIEAPWPRETEIAVRLADILTVARHLDAIATGKEGDFRPIGAALMRKANERLGAELSRLRAENEAMRQDARRWRGLIGCGRIYQLGSAGNPVHHLGLDLWLEHPEPTSASTRQAVTDFADRCAARSPHTATGTEI